MCESALNETTAGTCKRVLSTCSVRLLGDLDESKHVALFNVHGSVHCKYILFYMFPTRCNFTQLFIVSLCMFLE